MFWESAIETLVETGMGSSSGELLATLKKENRELFNRISKLENKIQSGESSKRISNYTKKVKNQAGKSANATQDLILNKIQEKGASGSTSSYIKNESKILTE